jgi:hypothetical protein
MNNWTRFREKDQSGFLPWEKTHSFEYAKLPAAFVNALVAIPNRFSTNVQPLESRKATSAKDDSRLVRALLHASLSMVSGNPASVGKLFLSPPQVSTGGRRKVTASSQIHAIDSFTRSSILLN